MGYLSRVFHHRQHFAAARRPGGISRTRPLQPAALHRLQTAQLRVDPVRRRRPSLCGSRVRQHGDGCRAANGVAPVHYRDHHCSGREVAFPGRCLYPEGRWKDRRPSALRSAVMTADANQLVDMMNGALESAIPIAHKMGVKVVEARPGFAATTVPAEGNGNHFGVIYAGVLFTVAEVLGGIIPLITFDTTKYFPLVKNLDIQFVAMAKSDVRAEASLDDETVARIEADAAERGKADFTLEAVVTDADGQTVATTRGLYQLRAIGK